MDKHCKMEYGKDAKGQEVLLKDGKFQVMMEWEKPYMHACIDALKPKGDVLEVGFGLGYSAQKIQSYHPKSHTIIEYHPEVLIKAREWAKKHPNVTIVAGTWQEMLPTLGVFDSIFFDDYPLQSESEIATLEKDAALSEQVLSQGNRLLQEVQKQLPFIYTIKYSEEDLKQFFSALPLESPLQVKQVARFLIELFIGAQISQEQLDKQLQKLVKTELISKEEIHALQVPPPKKTLLSAPLPGDRFYTFLSQCLKSHMRIESRFSCFLSSDRSRFEDETFFNEIIMNPMLEFHEEQLELEIPEHCLYFDGTKPLVITITKKG